MLDGKIQKKYLCLYPDCNKRYAASDGLRKHCKKYHRKWLEGKKPQDYGYEIPAEYEGDDYVRDYMAMVRAILAEEENNISHPSTDPSPHREPSPRESETSRENPSFMQPTPLVFPTCPFVLLSSTPPDLNIPIDFYASLFCSETI